MKVTRALLGMLVLIAGCSQPAPPGAADVTKSREEASLASLKSQYKPVITGIDVKGATLDVFVDNDQLISMDEPAEDQLKSQALARWKKIWVADHRGQHATLHVRLRNYYGETVFSESAKV